MILDNNNFKVINSVESAGAIVADSQDSLKRMFSQTLSPAASLVNNLQPMFRLKGVTGILQTIHKPDEELEK